MVLSIKNLFFKYENQTDFLIKNFSLEIVGAERITITGKNGAGKSTLIKLIRDELMPNQGKIKIGVDHAAYLDQSVSFLNPNLTLIDNFLLLNPMQKHLMPTHHLLDFNLEIKMQKRKYLI